MQVYISGQLGRMAVEQGQNVAVLSVDEKFENAQQFPKSQLKFIFDGARDIKRYLCSSESDALKKLNLEYEKDRALILSLILVDPFKDKEISGEAVPILEDFLSNPSVLNFVKNRFFAFPMEGKGDLEKAIEASSNCKSVSELFFEVLDGQDAIQSCRLSWDNLSSHLFDEAAPKDIIELALIDSGAFKNAAYAIMASDANAMNTAKLECFTNKTINNYKNFRGIISSWLNPISPKAESIKKSGMFAKILSEENNKNLISPNYKPKIEGYEAYDRATRQIEKIKLLLKDLKLGQARSFTEALIKTQMESSEGNTFAAKSLCNIAKYAQDTYQHEFALEMNLQAVQIAPTDGLAWAFLSDTYISMSKYGEAELAINRASLNGYELYSDNARMRILVKQGAYEQAVKGYQELLGRYEGEKDYWKLLSGIAEAYKCLADYDNAIDSLKKSIQLAENEADPRCMLGELYLHIGRLEEGLNVFQEACITANSSIDSYLGVGFAYREMKQYEQSLKAFTEAQKYFKDSPLPYKEIGKTQRLMSLYKESLSTYKKIKKEFPFDYMGYVGSAEVFIELKKFNNAKNEFRTAQRIEGFVDTGFKIRYARMLKAIGETSEALQKFSSLVEKNPFNSSVKIGQAELLKELGHYDKAIEFYKGIDDKKVRSVVSVSMAAIYTAQERYTEALELLPSTAPKTKSDWVGQHILGMIKLKSEKYDEAIEIFENATRSIPFVTEKAYFTNALAVAYMRKSKYREALEQLESANEPISNVIKLHAYCAINDIKSATQTYSSLKECNLDNVLFLSKEIAAHFGIDSSEPQHSPAWIRKQECDILTIAVSQRKAA